MDAWLGLSYQPTEEMVDIAVVAEDAGYAGVTASDHLVWPGRIESTYPYARGGVARWPADTEWPDAWVLAGAVLQATSTLRFVTNVYLPTLRDPVVAAKSVGTAAVLSGGRVVLGVGAGWMREEFEVLDRDFDARGPQLDADLDTMRQLWTGSSVAGNAAQQAVGGILMRPAPRRSVPIWVGGHSPPALRRALRHDGWIGVLSRDPHESAAQAASLRQRHEDAGRRTPFTITVTGFTEDVDVLHALADAGVDGILLTPGRLTGADPASRDAAIRSYADRVLSKLH